MTNIMEAAILAIAVIAAATAIGLFLDGIEQGFRTQRKVKFMTAAKRAACIACAFAVCIIAIATWLWMTVS